MCTDVKYDVAYVWPEPGSIRAGQLLEANFEYHTSGAGGGGLLSVIILTASLPRLHLLIWKPRQTSRLIGHQCAVSFRKEMVFSS